MLQRTVRSSPLKAERRPIAVAGDGRRSNIYWVCLFNFSGHPQGGRRLEKEIYRVNCYRAFGISTWGAYAVDTQLRLVLIIMDCRGIGKLCLN